MNSQTRAHISIGGRCYPGIFIKDFGFVVEIETVAGILGVPATKVERVLAEYGDEFPFPTHVVFTDENKELCNVATFREEPLVKLTYWFTVRGVIRLFMGTLGDLPSREVLSAFHYPILQP